MSIACFVLPLLFQDVLHCSLLRCILIVLLMSTLQVNTNHGASLQVRCDADYWRPIRIRDHCRLCITAISELFLLELSLYIYGVEDTGCWYRSWGILHHWAIFYSIERSSSPLRGLLHQWAIFYIVDLLQHPEDWNLWSSIQSQTRYQIDIDYVLPSELTLNLNIQIL